MKTQLTVSLSAEAIHIVHKRLAKKIVDTGRNITLSEIIDEAILEKQ